MRTCGDCEHLGGVPTRQVRWCEAQKVWTYAHSPRGEPGPFHCGKWSERLAKPDRMS